MSLVDTHCHLMDPRFDADREEVLAKALEILDWLVVIGEDPGMWDAVLCLARERVYAAIGVHPYHAGAFDDGMIARLAALAQSRGVAAIGEIGLDYYNEYSPRAAQKNAFRKQLGIAADLGRPVVVHNRNADEDAYAILRDFARQLPAVVLHCFGSDATFAERCVDAGFYISFAGNVTFPKAQKLREAAAVVPIDRLLVETDAPYLAPQVRRGKRCEPSFITGTALALAEIKGVSEAEFAERTTENARRVFLRMI